MVPRAYRAQPSHSFSCLSISLKFKAKAALSSHFIRFAIYLETFIIKRTNLEQRCIVNKFFQLSIPEPPKKYYS